MDSEKKRHKSHQKKGFQRYMLPISIILLMVIAGLIGYIASQTAVNKSMSDSIEKPVTKNQGNEARNHSLKIIETELPKIINDLHRYNQDLKLLDQNVEWLNKNLDPIRNSIENFDLAITVIKGVNSFVKFPIVGNISDKLASAQIQLKEIDKELAGLEKLDVIQQEMNDSHQNLDILFNKYQKEKNTERLFQIEQELDSNLIYQIESLRDTTIEVQNVLELSSGVLITVNKTRSLFISLQETGKDTLNAIQFWKENEVSSKIETEINEDLEKDLDASIKKIKKLPNELAERSQSTITSINKVQKELQTIKVAQMISNE